ncbi:putative nuclease HARBI1 [Poeciliopsis prolifica]|uniref:putative nuclease HARBI1 n=1 Tax=Poeciliopsis prolifica TaxID=188132 RepID=UPI00072D26E2|nr:putative nuclease HARBI1 [Poeciliopsis prolifica]
MAFPAPVWLAVQEELLEGGEPEEDCDSQNCFNDFTDQALFENFHLSRACITFIADAVRLRVKSAAFKKSHPPVDVMLMTALSYYAHGMFNSSLQAKTGINQPTGLVNAVNIISGVIAGMSDVFISFPLTAEARARTASRMEELCGIPGVLGVLAPAHFKIRASPYDKKSFKSFINTLGYTSVVSQFMCDAEGNILSVEKCCVGSAFEQELWESSFKGREVEDGLHGPFWFIAGKGYRLSKHVLTPVSNPAFDREVRFNEAHAKVRRVMQSMLGAMKRRFRCLQQLGFAEEACLNKKSNIIKSCSVLHNIAKKFSVPLPPRSGVSEPSYTGKLYTSSMEIDPEALKARQELIDRNFSASVSSRDSPQSQEDP